MNDCFENLLFSSRIHSDNYSCIYIYLAMHETNAYMLYLSALVGCWLSVFTRRFIYNFLNLRHFDNTALVVI